MLTTSQPFEAPTQFAPKNLPYEQHARAAAIDKLPRFYIRGHAGTLTDMVIENP